MSRRYHGRKPNFIDRFVADVKDATAGLAVEVRKTEREFGIWDWAEEREAPKKGSGSAAPLLERLKTFGWTVKSDRS